MRSAGVVRALAARLALLGIVGILAWACSSTAWAQQRVDVPSLDRRDGQALALPGFWFAPVAPMHAATAGAGQLTQATASAPALVLLHGCGGMYERSGRLAPRYTELAARLRQMGVATLVLDSLTPRGETELCTQRNGQRQVTMSNRRRDALGALQWLAAQPGVDATRLGLLGWSNGGSTVLAATNTTHAEARAASVKPSLAVAYYPGCASELARGYRAVAPLLLLVGEADDWTPAQPCRDLAAQAAAAPADIQLQLYPGAYHGFDGTAAVRLRRDVPNGTHPGQGVHVGGDPAARAASQQALEAFLRERWALR